MSEAQHAGAIGAYRRRQVAQRKHEAELEAEVEAIYRKALDAHENTTPQAIRAAILARDAAAAEAERGRERDAARRVVDGAPAEADPVPVRTTPEPSGPSLPGGLTPQKIVEKYHALAAGPPGWRNRRRHLAEPSRPEMASALNVSTATLKRACKAAGMGTRWPPAGL